MIRKEIHQNEAYVPDYKNQMVGVIIVVFKALAQLSILNSVNWWYVPVNASVQALIIISMFPLSRLPDKYKLVVYSLEAIGFLWNIAIIYFAMITGA